MSVRVGAPTVTSGRTLAWLAFAMSLPCRNLFANSIQELLLAIRIGAPNWRIPKRRVHLSDDGARGSLATALCHGRLNVVKCSTTVHRMRFYDTRVVPHEA